MINETAGIDFEKIDELTAKLPPLEMLMLRSLPGMVEYATEQGSCMGYNLLYQEDVAIQQAVMTEGSVFKNHIHKDESEVLVVYKGRLEIHVNDQIVMVLKPGDSYKFAPGTVHSWRAVEECWMIAITVPAAKGYPRVTA